MHPQNFLLQIVLSCLITSHPPSNCPGLLVRLSWVTVCRFVAVELLHDTLRLFSAGVAVFQRTLWRTPLQAEMSAARLKLCQTSARSKWDVISTMKLDRGYHYNVLFSTFLQWKSIDKFIKNDAFYKYVCKLW